MPKFLLKIFIIVFAFAIFTLPIFAQAISASGPIVTCGRAGQPFCNLCDIPVLIKNLIDYMTFYAAFPLAALMFVVGGYFYLIAGGSSQKISQAKEVFFTTVKGLGIVLLSWLFIAELMVVLTGGANFNGLSRPWNQLESPTSCPFGTPVVVIPPVVSFGCDYDDAGNGICVLGGPGTACSPSDPSACGGGGCLPGFVDCAGSGICVPEDECGAPIGKKCVVGEFGEPTGACSEFGTGGTCTDDSQCGSPPIGKKCEVNEITGEPTGVCSVSGTGSTCTDDSQCGSPPVCEKTPSDCEPPPAPPGFIWQVDTDPNVCECYLQSIGLICDEGRLCFYNDAYICVKNFCPGVATLYPCNLDPNC